MQRLHLTAASLAALVLVGCASPEPGNTRRLVESHNLLRRAGYVGPGPIATGTLDQGGEETLQFVLRGNTCYILAAFGGGGIGDLGLVVSAPDESEVAEDETLGPLAAVHFCTGREGQHQVRLSAQRGSGPYEVTYWVAGSDSVRGGGENANGAASITLGHPETGLLPPGQQFVEYNLVIHRRRLVVIDLQSRDFDTYLYLLRDGVEIARDDDGGVGLNSRISTLLEPGTYVIRVGSFANRGSGRFVLLVH